MRKPTSVLGCILALSMTLAVAQDTTTKKTTQKTSASKTQTSTKKSQAGSATKPGSTTKAGSSASSKSPVTLTDQKSKVSYALGLNLGTSLRLQAVDVNLDNLIQGIRDGAGGGKAQMTDEEARTTLEQWRNEMVQQQQQKQQETALATKKESDAFLAINKTKEGVITLPDGLQYKILKQGDGPKPTATDKVTCNYRGTLINGTEFDSSYKRGQPASFDVSHVIKGWTEALQLMPVGSKWQLFIPADLAYGASGAGRDIPPNSALIFEVELLSIEPHQQPPQQPGQPQAPPPSQPQQQQPAQQPPQPKTPPVTPK